MLSADHCFRKGEMFILMESVVTIYTDRKKKAPSQLEKAENLPISFFWSSK